jgi:hypothetical protein
MGFDTAANIVNDAAVELGLIPSDLANPYDSTNTAVVQLCRFLKGAGQDLTRDFLWTHLQKTHTFSTANGTAAYALPADFGRSIAQTHWNRTSQEALGGPIGAQAWQQIQAVSGAGTYLQLLRMVNNEIQLSPTPTSIQTIAFEYISSYWVRPSGQASPTTDAPTTGSDTLHFDRRLLVAAAKLYWLKNKGFDTSAVQDEFDRALGRASSGDGASPVLSLGSMSGFRLLNVCNAPDTGFGS